MVQGLSVQTCVTIISDAGKPVMGFHLLMCQLPNNALSLLHFCKSKWLLPHPVLGAIGVLGCGGSCAEMHWSTVCGEDLCSIALPLPNSLLFKLLEQWTTTFLCYCNVEHVVTCCHHRF